MTTDAERKFARRVVAGMLKASCDMTQPAWRTDPVWGTWIRNEPTCRQIDAAMAEMSTEELEAVLAARNLETQP